jgi:hypothetical protein
VISVVEQEVSYYNTFMPSLQAFKPIYFPDDRLTLAFGEKTKDIYKAIANMASSELRNLLGTES